MKSRPNLNSVGPLGTFRDNWLNLTLDYIYIYIYLIFFMHQHGLIVTVEVEFY